MGRSIARMFDEGPPRGWAPAIGDRVAVYIGCLPSGVVTEVGTIAERFETSHYSGGVIVSWRIELDGNSTRAGRNSLRPVKEAKP